MHVYSEDCMLEIGNIIGKALKVDINTLAQCNNHSVAMERGRYARVSVEVDLNQLLKSQFVIRRRIYTVEYEGLDLICFTCGRYGHKQETCALKMDEHKGDGGDLREDIIGEGDKGQQSTPKIRNPLVSIPGIKEDEVYGSWMKAKNTFRPRLYWPEMERKVSPKAFSGGKQIEKASRPLSGTRFDILQELENPVTSFAHSQDSRLKVTAKEWRRKDLSQNGKVNVTCEEMAGQNFRSGMGESSESTHEHPHMTFAAEKREGAAESMKKERTKKNKAGLKKVGGSVGVSPSDSGHVDFKEFKIEMIKEVLGRKKLGQRVPKNKEGAEGPSILNKKRETNSRPIIISPILRRKNPRAHHIVIGSLSRRGPLDFSSAQIENDQGLNEGDQVNHFITGTGPKENLTAVQQRNGSGEPQPEPPDSTGDGGDGMEKSNYQDQGDCWFETQAEGRDDADSDMEGMDRAEASV